MNGIQNYVGSNYQPSFQQKGSLRRYGKLAKYVKVKKQQPQTYTKNNFIQKADKMVDVLMQHQFCATKRVGHEGIMDDLMKFLNS